MLKKKPKPRKAPTAKQAPTAKPPKSERPSAQPSAPPDEPVPVRSIVFAHNNIVFRADRTSADYNSDAWTIKVTGKPDRTFYGTSAEVERCLHSIAENL